MNFKIPISIIYLLFIATGCRKTNEDFHPEIMKPIWSDVKTKNLKLKIGDIISIKTEKNLLFGIIMDYDEDKMGIWYGICLSKTKIQKTSIKTSLFFGRKIPNGFVNTKCIDCFDLIYLNEKGVNENIIAYENIKLNRDNITIGSNGTAINISELEKDFEYGIKQRLKKPTKCDESILSLNRVDDRYMKLNNIIAE